MDLSTSKLIKSEKKVIGDFDVLQEEWILSSELKNKTGSKTLFVKKQKSDNCFILSETFYCGHFTKINRKNGPAYIKKINNKIVTEQYYINGQLHREDGPAIVDYENGQIKRKAWYINGRLHREDGPAVIKIS